MPTISDRKGIALELYQTCHREEPCNGDAAIWEKLEESTHKVEVLPYLEWGIAFEATS